MHNICVLARFRPSNATEKEQSKTKELENIPPYINMNTVTLQIPKKSHSSKRNSYKTVLDDIFNTKSNQKQIFEKVAKPLMNDALNGFNATLIAYGETSSGKKYSMFGANKRSVLVSGYIRQIHIIIGIDLINLLFKYCDNTDKLEFFYPSHIDTMGIIPRALQYLFEKLETKCSQQIIQTFSVSMQILQIYNKGLNDLLNLNTKIPLQIKTDFTNGCVFVKHLTSIDITSANEAFAVLFNGSNNRVILGQKFSCTGHPIRTNLMILLNVKQTKVDGSSLLSHIKFTALAGSELYEPMSENEPKCRKDALNINCSLSGLTRCINSLVKQSHPSYRDTPLTHILQDELGGNCKTTFLLCMSSHIYNRKETIRTLRFGTVARSVRNRPKINETLSAYSLQKQIKELMLQNVTLKAELININGVIGVSNAKQYMCDKMELNKLLEEEVQNKNELLEKYNGQCLELNKCDEIITVLQDDIQQKVNISSNIQNLEQQLEEVKSEMKCFMDTLSDEKSDIGDEIGANMDDNVNMQQGNQQIANEIMQSEHCCWYSLFFDDEST